MPGLTQPARQRFKIIDVPADQIPFLHPNGAAIGLAACGREARQAEKMHRMSDWVKDRGGFYVLGGMDTPVNLPPIHVVRGQRVILDADLAKLYGVTTMAFNQAVRRNMDRFPTDFVFQLTREEVANLMSQNVILSSGEVVPLRSQIVILKRSGRGRHRKYLPWAFTEHGAIMAAMILRSPHAVAMSVYIVRAYVRMREELLANAVILKRLAQVDKRLLEHDVVLRDVVGKL